MFSKQADISKQTHSANKTIKSRALNTALTTAIILLVSVFAGVVLLTASFSLPNSSIATHVEQSISTLEGEGEYPKLIDGLSITSLDNYTDSLMLNSAAYLPSSDEGYTAIDRAMLVPRATDGNSQITSLAHFLNSDEVSTENYSRYWHGYMIFLRPMLLFYDYNMIRFILFAIHLLLSACFLVLLNRKCGNYATFAFVVMYVITGGFIVPFSLSFSNVATVTLVSGIAFMLFSDWLVKNRYVKYFFLVTGIVTVFSDLLTFPLMTLGVNLCLYVLIVKDVKLKDMLIFCIIWGTGYAGMWAGKWVVASILTGENVIADATGALLYRTGDGVPGDGGNSAEHITYLSVLQKNLAHYCKKCLIIPYLIVLICGFVIKKTDRGTHCSKSFFSKIHFNKTHFDRNKAMCLFFIIVIPFLWYFALKNHSYIHSWFTFRALFPALLGVLLLPECFSKTLGYNRNAEARNVEARNA